MTKEVKTQLPKASGAEAENVSTKERTTATGMEALQSILMPDEKVLRVATISPGIYWKGIAVFILALIVMIKAFALGAFLMLVSVIMLGIAYMTRYFLLLAATDKRVIIRHGIINLDTIQFRYTKLESVELSRTIIGQLLGYASVVITGTGSRVTVVPFIADASKFREELNKILFEQDEKASA
ncbi:MAG: PH domain-containing protein [Micavibrio aeruginosavorus]|uniref:PH domain-containing protein n=1 Tax=Micavibrio aeruginosavorus TaxID=349221 RepID=A0A7T5R0H4_9BACT|nr:MAG: PH domain-containing protein [Micavibrio aeruginosavorus]